jgi:hypothetical protein
MSYMGKYQGEAGLEIAQLVTCVLSNIHREIPPNRRDSYSDLMRAILGEGVQVSRPLQSPNPNTAHR